MYNLPTIDAAPSSSGQTSSEVQASIMLKLCTKNFHCFCTHTLLHFALRMTRISSGLGGTTQQTTFAIPKHKVIYVTYYKSSLASIPPCIPHIDMHLMGNS